MHHSSNVVVVILSGLVTTMITYLLVRFSINDSLDLLIPGWHTTVYSGEIMWILITAVMLLAAAAVTTLFDLTRKMFIVLMSVLIKNRKI
jgi:hypothetical protein